jgi:hypothetical protein
MTCACALLLAGSGHAQPFPAVPVPGFNVGLNPVAFVSPTTVMGQFGFYLMIPGTEAIATFYDPGTLPAGTTILRLLPVQWAVYEPNACAVGAGLFFDTQAPLATVPVATVGTTGWNIYGSMWPLGYAGDPFYSTWSLSYCSVSMCTSPCGPQDHDPDWEIYLFRVI